MISMRKLASLLAGISLSLLLTGYTTQRQNSAFNYSPLQLREEVPEQRQKNYDVESQTDSRFQQEENPLEEYFHLLPYNRLFLERRIENKPILI